MSPESTDRQASSAPMNSDRVLRSLTEDGGFRVITAVTTETVRAAVRAQGVRGDTARWLGELMTGAVLLRESVSPDRRVQVIIRDAEGKNSLVADAHPTGWNRGIVGLEARNALDPAQHATLEVIYTLPNDVLQQGIVPLPAACDVSTALMTYMQESEQIVTTIATRAIVDHEDSIRASGGFLVQILPGTSHDALLAMTRALESFNSLDEVLSREGVSPEAIRDALLRDQAARDMAHAYLCFGCTCDRARILRGLASLAREEIDEMLDDGEPIEIRCDACGQRFVIGLDELRDLHKGRPS